MNVLSYPLIFGPIFSRFADTPAHAVKGISSFSRALVVSAGFLAITACTEAKAHKAEHAMPPPTVYFANVTRHDLPLFIEAVGSLDGYDNADIRARVKGFLQTQKYKDGAYVKAGQTLFTIEATEYSAALASASANLTRAKVAVAKNKVELKEIKAFSIQACSRGKI